MNKICIGAISCIIIIFLFMCGISYSYFSIPISGESKNINVSTLSDDINIEYKETSNLSLVNGYTGDKLVKTFIVKNKGDIDLYFNVVLDNVVNNFEDESDLVYRINSSNGVVVKEKVLPSTDSIILRNILIKGHEEQTYNLEIEFLNKDTDQSINMNKTFSSNIKITSSDIVMGDKLYKDGTLIKMISESSISNESLFFKEKKDGIYYTNSSTDGITTYYYYGSKQLNNNLVLGNLCYRILRTTEDYGVRVIYSGTYENGKCNENNNRILSHKFNSKFDNNAYVGYMYGNASSSSYETEHENINSSDVKILLDTWYSTNVSSYDNLISKKAFYCNDRSLSSFIYNGVSYDEIGYSKNNTGYLFMNLYNNKKDIISFDCKNDNDRFSVDKKSGNGKLVNSIGLISANELYYSGYLDNKENYLSSSYDFWTLTPAYFNASGSYNFIASNNKLVPTLVNKTYYVRPVLTFNSDVKLMSGDGSITNPYMVSF